jgi:inosine/xanthosine triphosphatase
MSNSLLKQTVTVGSLNPVKINAVKQAFTRVWPSINWVVNGVATESGVSPQPMSDQECILGARNRAQAVLRSQVTDFAVGLEGGLHCIDGMWFDCGWIVVLNQKHEEGIGSTARIITPPKMVSLIDSGHEMGEIVDRLFQTKNAKQKQGHFGLMTDNAITRTTGYRDGVIMALARFLHPELF